MPRNVRRLATELHTLNLAAPLVVAHRMRRLDDRRERFKMGAEKIAAWQMSWLAMGSQAMRMQLELAQAWSAVAFGRPRALERLASRSISAYAGVLAAGVTPVRRKAVGNARRLARKRK